MRTLPAPPTFDELRAIAREHRIDRLGVAPADVLQRTRRELFERREAGLHADMSFTYRNPERSTDPRRTLPSATSAIVAARSYVADHEPPRPAGYPMRVARYAWADYYEELRTGLRAIVTQIKASGHKAVALADDNAIVDRELAHRAGLGWYGKNANLLLPGAGSYFVLGSVITDIDYTDAADDSDGSNGSGRTSDEPVATGCGSCRRCIDACPTGAIVADGVIDANRCLAWILQRPGPIPVELRTAVGDRLYGCDDCQTVCPPAVRLGRRHERSVESPQAWVDALDLLDADDTTLLERHGRWYIAGRDPRWLRRNALIVLGNVGDPNDPRCREALDRYRHDDDPVLSDAASWAVDQLTSTVARR